jgi:hypothetical protein
VNNILGNRRAVLAIVLVITVLLIIAIVALTSGGGTHGVGGQY